MGFTRHGWRLLFLPLFFFSGIAQAKEVPHAGTLREKKWTVKSGECGLSRFSVENFEHENVDPRGAPGLIRGSMMAAVAETSDPSCLKDFAVVQYIRGCIYNVRYKRAENRVTDRYFGIVREQRGKTIPFSYSKWDVDTVDEDPLYQSNPDSAGSSDRMSLYRIPRKPLALRDDAAAIARDGKVFFSPKNYGFLSASEGDAKSYFVSDVPTFAEWIPEAGAGEEEWINTSLEFETCIYRTKDIPFAGNPQGPHAELKQGGPLACIPWSHKKTFDPLRNAFHGHSGIDPTCSALPLGRNPR